jgi:hypothetical protein
LLSFFLLQSILAVSAEPAAAVQSPAANDSLVIAAEAGWQSLKLSDCAILQGTDSLSVNGRTLRRDQDYAMDYAASRAMLAWPLLTGDTVRVYFFRLPFGIAGPVRYLPPALPPAAVDSAARADAAAPATAVPDWLAERSGGIRMWGNKSLAVAVGSGRDLSIEQALQVSISGRVGQNLELNAYLSDQEMPLSTTGSTQELDQLDRVYLQAKAPSWEVTMGDYDLNLDGFRLLGAERQAKGALAGVKLNNLKATAVTAVAKGRRATVRFSGQDGIQGPYLLNPGSGSVPPPILPNSERVWLDGQLLRRGEAEDYSMDYAQAKLTFTPRRPVSADSRIMVDYQYAEEEYRRSLTGGDLEVRLAPGLRLGVGYLSDGDDPERPLLQPLDERQRSLLAEAGDDSSKLWADGGVPSDSGDYDRDDSVYVYVGPGGGYRVTFTWLGTGQGDYSYRPLLGYYVYMGPQNGDYVARIRVPRPELRQAVAVSPRLSWEGGRAEFEGAWSRSDLNVSSGLDDGDNEGSAWCYEAGWARDSLPWGGFQIASRAWNVQQNFWTGAARSRPDLASEWGLAGWRNLRQYDPLAGRRSHQHELSYWPGRYLRVGGGYGSLRLSDSLSAERFQLWTTAAPVRGWETTYRRQEAELAGPWFDVPGDGGSRTSQSLENRLSAGAYQFDGGAGRSDDMIEGANGRDTRSQDAWAGARRSLGRGTIGSRYRRQEELRRDSLGGWCGQWYADEVASDLRLQPLPSAEIGLEHASRVKRLRPGVAGQGIESHLGLLRLSAKPWRQALTVSSDYSLNFTQTQQKREEYYQVPAGTGQYSYDPSAGVFYPDTAGSYLRRVLDEGPAAGTSEVSVRGSAAFDPSLAFTPAWWSRARIELSGQARIASYRPVTAKLLGLAPSRLWDRQGNASSSLDLSGDAWYRLEPWSHHLRLRWRRDDDNQFIGRHYTQSRTERSWDGWLQAYRTLRLGLRAEDVRTEASTLERGLERRLNPIKLGAEVDHQARRDLELSLRAEALRERIERSYRTPGDFTSVFWEQSGEAGAVKQWGLNGSLRLSAGAVRRTADRPETDIAAEYAYTRPLGWTGLWRAQYEHRINRNLTATASYDARDEPGRRARHNGRMEVRAYF